MNYNFNQSTLIGIIGMFAVLANAIGTMFFTLLVNEQLQKNNKFLDETHITCRIGIVSCVFGVLLNILMVIGVNKKRITMIVPTVYFGFFGLMCTTLLWLYITFLSFFHNAKPGDFVDFQLRFYALLAIEFLLWYPVNDFYEQLKEEAKQSKNQNA